MAKKGKKSYENARSLRLVCYEHQDKWSNCDCEDTWMWILVTEKELKKYVKTGLVPDWKSELLWAEGEKRPAWKKPAIPNRGRKE